MSDFLSEEELESIGFKSIGKNVKLSRNACVYGANNISIGDNVRIDDFCVLSGNIKIENNVHIACYSALFAGDEPIELKKFSNVSSRCAIYSKTDDFSGKYMTNPTIDEKYTNIISKRVVLNEHVIIGTGSTILPGVTIGIGSAVGSMSLVNKSLGEWGTYMGIPCRYIKERKKDLLILEEMWKKENNYS